MCKTQRSIGQNDFTLHPPYPSNNECLSQSQDYPNVMDQRKRESEFLQSGTRLARHFFPSDFCTICPGEKKITDVYGFDPDFSLLNRTLSAKKDKLSVNPMDMRPTKSGMKMANNSVLLDFCTISPLKKKITDVHDQQCPE